MFSLLLLLSPALTLSCGFQEATAVLCQDVDGGRIRAPTSEEQRQALVYRMICARKETGTDMDPEDPALLIFWEKGESRADAMVDLADARVNGCD